MLEVPEPQVPPTGSGARAPAAGARCPVSRWGRRDAGWAAGAANRAQLTLPVSIGEALHASWLLPQVGDVRVWW